MKNYQQVLNQHFNIIGLFNLNAYENDMPLLYAELKKIKKEQYDSNDRIIFELFDHDFYLDNQGPGWALYNLQLILRTLDISNFFCLLLTHQPDYDEYTSYVQHTLTTDEFPIRSITTMAQAPYWLPVDPEPVDPQLDQIKKSYCVLSRQARDHRTFFISRLFAENLTDHGLIGYHNINVSTPRYRAATTTETTTSEFVNFLVPPDHYQKLLLRKQVNQQQVNKFQLQYNSFKNFNDNADVSDKVLLSNESAQIVSQGLLYVGLETHVNLLKVFISNIALRGIAQQRPFVLFACPGTLKHLQSLGFQTFGEFWNEDYDNITDAEERADRIIDIIKQLSLLSVAELKELYLQMQSVIQHNYNFYHTKFFDSELEKLELACLKNLGKE